MYAETINLWETTPPAFIWHTFEDKSVDVRNTLEYAMQLREYNISTEIHIFHHGHHGMGLATNDYREEKHVTQWKDLLFKWIKYIGW